MTPEQLREWADRMEARLDPTSDPEQLRAHADALEEIERLKAPASEGEIAETLKELREVGFYCEATVQDVIEIIESLAAKVAELEDDKRCLTVANEAMTNQANNAITRAERAEAELAEAERRGREQGMREAVGIIQAEKVDADTTGEDADEAYNLAITHCTGAILSAIGEGK